MTTNFKSTQRDENSTETVINSKKRSRSDSADLLAASNVPSEPLPPPKESVLQRLIRTSRALEQEKVPYVAYPDDVADQRVVYLDHLKAREKSDKGGCRRCKSWNIIADNGFFKCGHCGMFQNHRAIPTSCGGAHYINGQHTSEFTQIAPSEDGYAIPSMRICTDDVRFRSSRSRRRSLHEM